MITGQGRYVDDIKLPGMLHIVVRALAATRTPASRGIDTPRPRRCPASSRSSRRDDSSSQAGVPCALEPDRRDAAAGTGR